MRNLIFIIFVQFLLYSNLHAELKIKIDRAKIGTLPIMINIEGSSEKFSSNNFNEIIENDLYSSGFFNILENCKKYKPKKTPKERISYESFY